MHLIHFFIKRILFISVLHC